MTAPAWAIAIQAKDDAGRGPAEFVSDPLLRSDDRPRRIRDANRPDQGDRHCDCCDWPGPMRFSHPAILSPHGNDP